MMNETEATMRRTSGDEFRNGTLWNGYDYGLQVWVRGGIVEDCQHPESMGPGCCNGRFYAGQAVANISGHDREEEAYCVGDEA
jgi:hypothetical protein